MILAAWDIGFWVGFLPPLIIGGALGWWLRGEKAEDDAWKIEQARLRHPSRNWGQTWEWEDK